MEATGKTWLLEVSSPGTKLQNKTDYLHLFNTYELGQINQQGLLTISFVIDKEILKLVLTLQTVSNEALQLSYKINLIHFIRCLMICLLMTCSLKVLYRLCYFVAHSGGQ